MQTTKERQIEWLAMLKKIAPKPFYLADASKHGTPSYRTLITYYPLLNNRVIAYRTVLDNEIVFDLDEKNWNIVRIFARIISKYLDKNKIPYYMFGSGGKGIHISIFCDFGNFGELFGYQRIRVGIWDYLVEDMGFYGDRDKPASDVIVGVGKPMDKSCVAFSDR